MFERCARAAFPILVASALSLFGRVSGAEETDAAFALFQEGRELSAKGDYAGACAKFSASLALRRKLGTVLNLGDCSEHLGRTATAHAHFMEAASIARAEGDPARVKYANERADAVAGKVPHLVLRDLPAAAG